MTIDPNKSALGAGRPSRKVGLVALAWLVLGPTFMLAPLWRAPTSAGEDDVVYYFPLRVLVGRDLRAGRRPTWNPYEQCGMPLLADPQAAPLFPPTWLFAAVPEKLAYSLNIFLAFAVAGVGAYVYLRKIGLAPAAATFGATVFQYSGFMVGHRVHLSMICTAGTLGLGLWAIETLRDRPGKSLLALPWIVFWALSAGHYPTFVNLMIVWGVYLLVRGRPVGRALAVAGASVGIALLLAAPHVEAAWRLLGVATRQRVGYVTAGENSFLPTNVVLAFFPFLMGCRTQSFFAPHRWWGAWHLCETLGYVGLATLALAAGSVWRLWRRRTGRAWSPMVKLWTLLGAGASVWMLGYYVPPLFWLMHKLPIVSIIRAPARMVLVLELALATLAAVAVQALTTDRAHAGALARTVRRWAVAYLPACMAVSLALMAAVTAVLQGWYPGGFGQPFVGGPSDVWASLHPLNPAVWVPVVVLAGSAVALVLFLRAPRRRALILLVVLVCDLLVLTRHVDVPGRPADAIDPTASTTADLVKADAGGEPFRVLHLTGDYFVQPTEALAPKASAVFGVENLAGYGPFQTPEHAHLLSLGVYGYTRQWRWLVRRNYLLSLYNVRHLLCQQSHRAVIESVRVDDSPPPAAGTNLLTRRWRTHRAKSGDGIVRLETAFMIRAWAEQDVAVQPGRVYRIELEARAPEGAGGALLGEVFGRRGPDREAFGRDSCRLYVRADQMGRGWRRHTWTFSMPDDAPERACFGLETRSDSAIEVRNVALRPAEWERPINLGGKLAPGERVYKLVGRSGDGRIYVYRNRLCLPRSFPVEKIVSFDDNENVIEQLRWNVEDYDITTEALVVGPVPGEGVWSFQSVPSDLPFLPGGPRGHRANGIGRVVRAGESANADAGGGDVRACLGVAGSAMGMLLYAGVVVCRRRR